MSPSMRRWSSLLLLGAAALLVAGCEKPPMDSVQRGYRGLGMVEIFNPTIQAELVAVNQPPAPLPPAAPGSPPAKTVFKNVQVLGDVPVNEFLRQMAAQATWVTGNPAGCTYCHSDDGNLALDVKYTKVVARRMLQMTQHINGDWKNHVAVANVGVTCWTCHRGQPVPKDIWFTDPGPKTASGPLGDRAGQNAAAPAVGYASLPFDPLTPFLLQANDIRVTGAQPLPYGNHQSIKQAEWSLGLMMNISGALGVNCTYCHNSRSFADWQASTPQRTTAWYGIRMARDLNNNYMEPLKAVLPANRLGPTGDVPKIGCTTCHQGVYKPGFGVQMAKDYPHLLQPMATTPAQPVAAAAKVAAKK